MKNDSPFEADAPRYPWVGKRPFYGWIIVIVGAVTQFFQGIASQGFSSYMDLLQTEFGWTKAMLSGPRSITSIEGAITGPIEGILVDKFGPRKVVIAGLLISVLGYIIFGLTNNYIMYYVASMAITLGIGFQGLLVMSVTVNNWFNRKRTMAQAIMGLGYSMAGVIGVPLLVILQNNLGWRESCFITAAAVLVIGLPFAFLLKNSPESIGEVPDGKQTARAIPDKEMIYAGHDFTLKEAFRTRSFWLLAIGSSVGNLGILAAQLHLFLHLMEGAAGMDRGAVSLVWTVASLSNIPSRLIGGYLGDRLPKNIMLGVSMLFMAVAVYILAIAENAGMAFLFSVVFGIGWGIRTPILNAIQGEYFGRKSQGVIRGWLNSLGLPLMVAAPIVAGYMADIQGTYEYAFSIMAGIMVFGSALVLVAVRPKPPVKLD